MRRCLLSGLCAVAAALAGGPARADLPPRTFALEVASTEGCPGADGVHDAIRVAAGVEPVEAKAGAKLRVELLAGGALARGRWAMYSADGVLLRERTVTVNGSCKKLLGELVMTWVVYYETPPPPPAAPVAPCPPPTCDDACRAKVKDEVRRELLAAGYGQRMDPRVAVMVGGLLSAGYTADPGGGLFLAGELHGDVLSGAVEVHFLFPARVTREPSHTDFELTTVTGTIVPCARWGPNEQLKLLGCAFFDIGAGFGGGGVSAPSGPPVLATMGLGPRLATHFAFAERFAVRLFADLRIAPVPTDVVFIGTSDHYKSNTVSGLFGIGLLFE